MEKGSILYLYPLSLRALLLRLFIVALPLLPSVNTSTYFDGDWVNNLWMIQYQGYTLCDQLASPAVYNTTTIVGIPGPLFYSEKFYAILGVASLFIGPELVLRLCFLSLLFAQLFHIERLFTQVTTVRGLPLCVATLVTWSIYPLTNLYNRSALTEFVAAMLFTIAFASLLLFAWHLHRNQFSLYDFVVAGLFSTLAAAAHSLTALAGGFFFAFTVVGIFFMLPRARYVWFVLVNTLLAILVLSPWIYAVLLFRSRMPITDPVANARNFRYVGWPYDAFTNFLTRTSPFPIEFRALMDGTKIPTPHQDAQILMPLLVLVAFLYVFRSRISWQGLRAHVTSLPVFFPVTSENRFLQVLMYLFLLLFSAFFIICIYPVASVVFGGLFDIMQFSYRMITYVNLSLIAMAFALLAWFHANGGLDERRTQILTYVMVGCLSVSGVSLYEKLVHAEAMIYARYLQGVADPGNEEYLARIDYISNPGQLPRTYYAQYTYLITDHVQPMPENIDSLTAVTAQVALDPSSFDKTLPLQVRLDKPSFVITNIAPFPWNQLLINGNPVNPKELYAAPYDNYATYTAFVYGLQLPAGEYTLAYRFEPNSKWVFLQGVSWLVLLAWAGVYLWVVVRKCRVGHPLFAAPPPRLGRG